MKGDPWDRWGHHGTKERSWDGGEARGIKGGSLDEEGFMEFKEEGVWDGGGVHGVDGGPCNGGSFLRKKRKLMG